MASVHKLNGKSSTVTTHREDERALDPDTTQLARIGKKAVLKVSF